MSFKRCRFTGPRYRTPSHYIRNPPLAPIKPSPNQTEPEALSQELGYRQLRKLQLLDLGRQRGVQRIPILRERPDPVDPGGHAAAVRRMRARPSAECAQPLSQHIQPQVRGGTGRHSRLQAGFRIALRPARRISGLLVGVAKRQALARKIDG